MFQVRQQYVHINVSVSYELTEVPGFEIQDKRLPLTAIPITHYSATVTTIKICMNDNPLTYVLRMSIRKSRSYILWRGKRPCSKCY